MPCRSIEHLHPAFGTDYGNMLADSILFHTHGPLDRAMYKVYRKPGAYNADISGPVYTNNLVDIVSYALYCGSEFTATATMAASLSLPSTRNFTYLPDGTVEYRVDWIVYPKVYRSLLHALMDGSDMNLLLTAADYIGRYNEAFPSEPINV
jgi:hypothetical protein